MVFEHFNRFQPKLPSAKQIMHGIILAQIDQLSHLPKDVNFEEVIGLEASMWKRIFGLPKLGQCEVDN